MTGVSQEPMISPTAKVGKTSECCGGWAGVLSEGCADSLAGQPANPTDPATAASVFDVNLLGYQKCKCIFRYAFSR